MPEAERNIKFTQNCKDANNSFNLCAYFVITLISVPLQRQARCKPIVKLFQVCHKPVASPLKICHKSVLSPLQAHCKPTACCNLIVRAFCKPTTSPLQACCKAPVNALQAHRTPIIGPCKLIPSPLQDCCKLVSSLQSQQQGNKEAWKQGWDQRNSAALNLPQLISQPGLPSSLVPRTQKLRVFCRSSVPRITTTASCSQSLLDPPQPGCRYFPPSQDSSGIFDLPSG